MRNFWLILSVFWLWTCSGGGGDKTTGPVVPDPPVNSAPVSENQAVSTDEDTPVRTGFSSSDVDGNNLIFSVVSQPANGSVEIDNSNNEPGLYTPNENFNGTDTFTYKANDGQLDSNIATVTIAVKPINDAPIAEDDNVSTNENKMIQLDITLKGSDIDGDNLTYSIITDVVNGTTSLSNNTVTYIPSKDFNGSDGFTFKVNDGVLDSNVAQVVIGIAPVNDPPVVENMSVDTEEDVALSFKFSYTEIENDNLTFDVVNQPTNGTITIDNAIATYTPNINFNGSDTFTYKANDGQLDSNIASVSVNVNSVNDIPVSNDISISTNEDTPISGISLDGTDIDGDNLTYSIVTAPLNASIGSVVSNVVSYSPNANFNGEDSFTYKVNDGTSDSVSSTVSVTVNAINDAPTTSDISFSTDEDSNALINLLASDIEADSSSLNASVSNPPNGTVAVENLVATYTPNSNYNGTDTFTYTVNDGEINSNASTVTLYVNPIEDVPQFSNQTYSYPYGTTEYDADTLYYALDKFDADGDLIDWSINRQTGSGNGTFSIIETSDIDQIMYVNSSNIRYNDISEDVFLNGTDSKGNVGNEGFLSINFVGGAQGLVRVIELDHDWYDRNSDTNDLENATGLRDNSVSYVPFASFGRTGYIIEHRAGDIDGDGLGDVNNPPYSRDFDRFNYWTETSVYDIELNFGESSLAWDYLDENVNSTVPFRAYAINNFTKERIPLYAGYWDQNDNNTFDVDNVENNGPVYGGDKNAWEVIYLFWPQDESNSYDPTNDSSYIAADNLTTSGGCGWANNVCVESHGQTRISYPFMTATIFVEYLSNALLPTQEGHASYGSGYPSASAIIFDTVFDTQGSSKHVIQNNLIEYNRKKNEHNEIISTK